MKMDILKELEKNGLFLKNIPKKEQTLDMCKIAIQQNPLALRFASQKHLDAKLCEDAVEAEGKLLRYVPIRFITLPMCELAIESDARLLNSIPDEFRTLEICMAAIKKNITVLLYVPEEIRSILFENISDLALIKKIAMLDVCWLNYMPDRSDIIELCIQFMEKDFSIARHMSEQLKASVEILAYQKSKGKLKISKKYYDYFKNALSIEVKVLYGQGISGYDENKKEDCYYTIVVKFKDFKEFYDFLDGDLYNAELQDYDFEGIDLKQYNIEGAIINSEILDLQGLYDDSYFSLIKKRKEDSENKYDENEILSEDLCEIKVLCSDENELIHDNHNRFFYISDIHLSHRICNDLNKATKEEVHLYIKRLVKKIMNSPHFIYFCDKYFVSDNDYLLIAGDSSSNFELLSIFYKELVKLWGNPRNIIVVSGNHELCDPQYELEENIEIYRSFFRTLGITYLQNDLLYIDKRDKYNIQYGIIHEKDILKMSKEEIKQYVECCSVIVLGGIGFSGLNKKFNASNIIFGKSFAELTQESALQKDIQEAGRFNALYEKLLNSISKNRVIVLTHTKKEDWNLDAYNPNWIYVNGHNHHNFYEMNDKCVVFADNQIGYRTKDIGLKYFKCDNDYNVFAYYQDGIFEITKEQYSDFNRGKMVLMSFKRENGTIYMLKKKEIYMFFILCKYTKNSENETLYLLNGGKLKALEHNELEYYYNHLELYVDNVNQLMNKYTRRQQQLSDLIKSIGGSGRIHGCIIDVETPDIFEGYSYCHLFVNPFDGTVTPYFAYDTKERTVYRNLKLLLKENCKEMAKKYLQIEKESTESLPTIHFSGQMEEWKNKDSINDEGSYIYKISRIITSLQYCTEKNIIRLWKEELLNRDFITRIEQANAIEEKVNFKQIIDSK